MVLIRSVLLPPSLPPPSCVRRARGPMSECRSPTPACSPSRDFPAFGCPQSSIEKPRAFLSTTAGRLLIDRARRQRIEQAYLAELALAMEGCAHPSPKETLMAMQALAQIAAALDGLPPKPREAFLLHYLDGLTHAAVAQSLGVSDRMVRKYLALALLHCRAEFDQ